MTTAGESKGLVVVKLGGSLITDKRQPETPRPEVIERLAKEIAAARPALAGAGLLLGHGSGSFGHVAAKQAGLGAGPFCAPGQLAAGTKQQGASTTQHQAAKLHRLVVGALVEAGGSPWSWAPSSALTARAGKLRRGAIDTLVSTLELGLVPVVYGDVVPDVEWGAAIASTEAIVHFLQPRLARRGHPVARVIWCGETAGIFDPDGKTISSISVTEAPSIRRQLGDAAGTDVTGGMRLRLDTCVALARRGVQSWIVDGTVPGLLEAALRGESVPGTVVG